MSGPVQPVAADGGAPAAPPRRRGISGTSADMVRSLGILFAVIAVVWFVSGMWHNSTRAVTSIADWPSEIADIAPGAGFTVQAPAALPAGWSVTVIRLGGAGEAVDFTMTVTTADGHYLDLDEASGSVAARVSIDLPGAVAAGTTRVGSAIWTAFSLSPDERGNRRSALARRVSSTAVLISGTGSPADQAAFARSLHPVS